MTIEEWLEVQKKDGNVSLPLYIDENGNQCMQTNAYATRYGNSNVEEKLDQIDASCFYLQDGYTKTEKGLIRVPDGTDPKSIHYSGSYTCTAWQEGSIPIASNEVIVQVDMLDSYSRMLTAKYPTYGYVYINTLNANNAVWSGWKNITEQHAKTTFMNGWISNGHLPLLTKIGDTVWFNGILRSGTNTVDTVMATIPVGYRPYTPIYAMASTYKGGGLVSITSDGDIKIVIVMPDTNNVQLSAMWRIK